MEQEDLDEVFVEFLWVSHSGRCDVCGDLGHSHNWAEYVSDLTLWGLTTTDWLHAGGLTTHNNDQEGRNKTQKSLDETEEIQMLNRFDEFEKQIDLIEVLTYFNKKFILLTT